jgi:hypothetical protein
MGDSTWLRSRAVVIAFEECWPLGGEISIHRNLSSKLDILVAVTRAAKHKDAAGLGALAHAYRDGDRKMLDYVPDPRTLRIAVEALERPREFFAWALAQRPSEQAAEIVRTAEKYVHVATWQWDKACILAGALLATSSNTPTQTASNSPHAASVFPYWAALDKHTDQGKTALKQVAIELKSTYRQLIWASFYCESARVNELLPSPWFDAERKWRLGRAGLSDEMAIDLWGRAWPLVRGRLEDEVRSFLKLLESPLPSPTTSRQVPLL